MERVRRRGRGRNYLRGARLSVATIARLLRGVRAGRVVMYMRKRGQVMELCTICVNPAKFIEIEGGNYYCPTHILSMYGIESEGE
jgi:hypothetical protein